MSIELDDSLFIASGTNRACYTDPNDDKKCIKITISGNTKETNREISYYKFLQKKGVSWEMLAQFYGCVDTNLGSGEVVELIRDYDLDISKSLDSYFRVLDSADEIQKFLKLLQGLKEYLYKEKIYIKDLNAVNIVYQRYNKEDGRLVVIDGLAHASYIPFARSIDSLTLKNITKSWNHLIYKLKKRSSTKYSPILKQEIEKCNI
jgi:hypothetical protein